MLEQILVVVGMTFLVRVSPGPDRVIVMRITIVAGRVAGMQTSMGVLTGNLVHITDCVIGIGWIISQSNPAVTVLKYAGAAYLVYLGVMSLWSDPKAPDPEARQLKRRVLVVFRLHPGRSSHPRIYRALPEGCESRLWYIAGLSRYESGVHGAVDDGTKVCGLPQSR